MVCSKKNDRLHKRTGFKFYFFIEGIFFGKCFEKIIVFFTENTRFTKQTILLYKRTILLKDHSLRKSF